MYFTHREFPSNMDVSRIYKNRSENNALVQVSRITGVISMQYISQNLFTVPWASICRGLLLGKRSGLPCFVSKWMTRSKPCRSATNSELVQNSRRSNMKFLPEYSGDYWLSTVKIL